MFALFIFVFFFSSRRRHTRFKCDWSSDVCSSDLGCFGLRDLVFVVREDQVDAAGVNVERLGAAALPDLLERHGGALEVPSRPAPPKRRVPRGADLLVRRLGLLPQ